MSKLGPLLVRAAEYNRPNDLARQRDFLKGCIKSFGYMNVLQNSEPEDLYNLKESGTNRTFIQDSEGKLSKIQRRGISSKESGLANIELQIDNALGKLQSTIDTYYIKKTALGMYEKISEHFYCKGSLKRGYLVLVLYYSLRMHGIRITERETVALFENAWMADLPAALKNMKEILNLPDIEDPDTSCDMSTFLGAETIDAVNAILSRDIVTKDKEGLLAVIYYVSKITYPELEKFCKKFNCKKVKENVAKLKSLLK